MSTATCGASAFTVRFVPWAEYSPLRDATPEIAAALEAYRVALLGAQRALREWRADEESPWTRAALHSADIAFGAAHEAVWRAVGRDKSWWVGPTFVARCRLADEFDRPPRWAEVGGLVDVVYHPLSCPLSAKPPEDQ